MNNRDVEAELKNLDRRLERAESNVRQLGYDVRSREVGDEYLRMVAGNSIIKVPLKELLGMFMEKLGVGVRQTRGFEMVEVPEEDERTEED